MNAPTQGWSVTDAAAFDDAALAALFERAYAGYAVPVHVDAATMQLMVGRFDLDRGASRIGHREGGACALAMLGLRGDEGWIGGMGVVPERRRGGDGRRIMRAVIDSARERGVRTLRLEVLVQNEAAFALYRELGFEAWRELEVWARTGAWDAEPGAPVTRPLDPAVAHAWIAARRGAPEPWQRADGTLDRMRGAGAELAGLEVVADGARAGVAVLARAGERVSVMQWAVVPHGDPARAAARALAAAAAAMAPTVRVLNAPAGDPLALAFAEAGGTCEARQHEMALPLGPGAHA